MGPFPFTAWEDRPMASTFPAPDLKKIKAALVARQAQTFASYGIEEDPEQFIDRLVDLMAEMYPACTVDELLLRPREAILFCDAVRHGTGYIDLPDDIILRPLLNRRKQG
jgi:hypothetical protein